MYQAGVGWGGVRIGATCCAFEMPPWALALGAAEAGAGVAGGQEPAERCGTGRPAEWSGIFWSVFDPGLRSQLLLYLFVCNLIFSKPGRQQQGRKAGMEEGASLVTTPLPNELISIFAPPASSALSLPTPTPTLLCCWALRSADTSSLD